MKLSELKKPAKSAAPPPAEEPQERGSTDKGAPEEPQYVTSTTPSGIEVYYSWAPRRLYRLRQKGIDYVGNETKDYWTEVPSVTTVLGVLDKSGPLTFWAQGIGAEGVLELHRQEAIDWDNTPIKVLVDTNRPKLPPTYEWVEATRQNLSSALVDRRISVNHVKDKAADRGVNVHGALERWVDTGAVPATEEWPHNERGYVQGLRDFMLDIDKGLAGNGAAESELMVGSLEHQYAGRFDLVLTLDKPCEVVTRHYPKRKPKVEEIPAGRYLMDLKTRKKASVYNTNFLQLEAYEHAAVECGYAPTDYRAVIVVTEDGGYQVSVNQDWCFGDFLAVRKVYSVLNEREVLRVLRDELNATEVK